MNLITWLTFSLLSLNTTRCSHRKWVYQFGTCHERCSHCQSLEGWRGKVNVLLKVCCSGSVCVRFYVSVCIQFAFVYDHKLRVIFSCLHERESWEIEMIFIILKNVVITHLPSYKLFLSPSITTSASHIISIKSLIILLKPFIIFSHTHEYLQVKLALKQALEMSESDRVDRMRRNLEFSSRLTTLNWYKFMRFV